MDPIATALDSLHYRKVLLNYLIFEQCERVNTFLWKNTEN